MLKKIVRSLLFKLEKKLLFYPINTTISDVWIDLNKQIEDIYFYSLDGIKLNGWYVESDENKPTIIYCHGQGENISLWQDVLKEVVENGYGMFMIDYRGHGRSEGQPFECGLYIDLESAVKYLNDCKKLKNEDIVLWGRSLGGAVVADVASRNLFRAVILESTFTNLPKTVINMCQTGSLKQRKGSWGSVLAKFMKYFPFTQKFDTEKKISKINSPLLIGHSLFDDMVSVQMSKELSKRNPSAKLFISDKGSHHDSEWFLDEAMKFLKAVSNKDSEFLKN